MALVLNFDINDYMAAYKASENQSGRNFIRKKILEFKEEISRCELDISIMEISSAHMIDHNSKMKWVMLKTRILAKTALIATLNRFLAPYQEEAVNLLGEEGYYHVMKSYNQMGVNSRLIVMNTSIYGTMARAYGTPPKEVNFEFIEDANWWINDPPPIIGPESIVTIRLTPHEYMLRDKRSYFVDYDNEHDILFVWVHGKNNPFW